MNTMETNQVENKVGAKYQEGLDVTEIAKLIRRDIKAAGLPARCSVRVSRYSMGQSITINAVVAGPVRHGDVERENTERAQGLSCPWLTREAHAVQEVLERIGHAYNYDRSDIMTDYFDVNFYLHVNLKEAI